MKLAVVGAGFIGRLRALQDYRPLVEDPQVDAVVISTPVHLHEEMAVAALAAGKHVLCEEPLSNSVESYRRILDAARAHGRMLAVGFNHRYYPSVKFLGYRFFIEAYGDRGMARAYYVPMFNLLITQDRPGGPRRRQMKFYPEIMLREKVRGWTTTAYLSFQEELVDFLRMIRGERAALADGRSGLRAVEIAHAVYHSSATGSPVTLSRA